MIPAMFTAAVAVATSRGALLHSDSHGTAPPKWEYHGVVFGGGEWSTIDAAFGTPAAKQSLRAAVAAGASSVRFLQTFYVDTVNSTVIYRNAPLAAAPAGPPAPFTTESDEGLGVMIDLAKALGMKVHVGPIIDPNWRFPWNHRSTYPGPECLLWRKHKLSKQPPNCSKSVDPTPTGRGTIGLPFTKSQWDEWFTSYRAILRNLAKLASVHHADVLLVAAELSHAQNFLPNIPRWTSLMAEVRTDFPSGKLAIAQNAQSLIPWSASIDILGFDMYNGPQNFGDVPTATATPPTVAELAASWRGYIGWLKNVSATTGKPIIATELGFQSRPRSYVTPAGATRYSAGDCSVSLKCVSLEDQRTAYAGFYRAFGAATLHSSSSPSSSPWFLGVFFWIWRSDPTSGGVNDPSFTPAGKPAAEEMKRWAVHTGTLLSPSPPLQQQSPPLVPASASSTLAAAVTGLGKYTSKENGVVFGSGEWTGWEDPQNSSRLDSAAAAASLKSAAETGVNSIELIPTWFFPACAAQGCKPHPDTRMYRGETTSSPHALRTDSDAELKIAIRAAKALGMKVSLSPMFDPDYSQDNPWNASSGGPSVNKSSLAGGGAGRGAWGKSWNSTIITQWFQEYTKIIVNYARLAEETKCDSYHIGHELHTLLTNAENGPQWEALIKKVRAVYSGSVAVAFNGNPFFSDMAKNGVPYLSQLDFIGLDCYWPIMTNLSSLENWWDVASVKEIVAGWQPIVALMANVSKIFNLTITCTEVGYQSRNYAWIRGLNSIELDPRDCSSTPNCVNTKAQAVAYEGLLAALYPHEWFNGVYLWLWRSDPTAGGVSDESYVPQNKPETLTVMKRYFT